MNSSGKVQIGKLAVVGIALLCIVLIVATIMPTPVTMRGGHFLSIGTSQIVSASPDWLSGWDYRKELNVEGTTAGAATNYTLSLIISYNSSSTYYQESQAIVSSTALYFENNDIADDGTIYAGCGTEYGSAAIYRSTDLGQTWTDIFDFPASPTDYRPQNVRTVFLDSNGALFVSGGRASIWRCTSPTDESPEFSKVASNDTMPTYASVWGMVEDSSGNYYTGVHYVTTPPTVYKGTDSGATWNKISSAAWTESDVNCIGINPATDWVYAALDRDEAGIWRTKNGGDTWTQIVNDIDYKLAICAYDSTHIFLGTEDSGNTNKIAVINDDGTDGPFTPTMKEELGDIPVLWGRKVNDELWFGTGYTGAGSSAAEVVRSMDGGETWEQIISHASPSARTWYYFATANPDRADTIYVTDSTYAQRILISPLGTDCNNHCQTDFDDLRFTTSDGTTLIPHWTENYVLADYAQVSTNFDDLAASPNSTMFYMYYGNLGAESASNGADTFIQFDDFEWGDNGDPITDSGGTITWTQQAGDVDISTGQAYGGTRSMKLIGDSSRPNAKCSQTTGTDYEISFRIYKEDDGEFIFRHSDGSERINVRAYAADDIQYFDDVDWIDTGADLGVDEWELLEFNDINHAIPKYDIWLNGTKIQDDADMDANTANTDNLNFVGTDSADDDVWIDNVIVRSWCSPEPASASWGEEEGINPQIINSPSSNDFGLLEVNGTGSTAINYFTIENTGNCNVDVTIHGTDATGGDDTWTLSDSASPGENIYGLYAGLDDDDDTFDVIVRKTETYNTLASDLAEEATQDWGLKAYMPSSISGYDNNEMTATITLVASEAS
jgi:hypothetical protein